MAKKRKDTVYIPPVSTGTAAASAGTLMGLTEAYRQMIAQARLGKAQLTGSFRTAKADIERALAQNLTAAEGAAEGMGRLGSSTDLQNRMQARADAFRALEEARAMKRSGLEQTALGVQQAGTTLQVGLTTLEAQRAAEQAEMAVGEFETDMTPGGGGGPGPGGEPAGPSPGRSDLRNLDTVVARLQEQLMNATPDSDRYRILRMQLERAWKRRNQLRRRMGLKTLPVPGTSAAFTGAGQPGVGQQA